MNIIIDTKLLAYGRDNIVSILDLTARLIERAQQEYPFDDKIKVFCCTDIGKSSYRLSIYPKYKTGRFYGDPEEYLKFRKDYTNGLVPLLHHFGFNVLDIEGLEADDQASILVNHLLPKDELKVLVTEDRDWLQSVLSNENTAWLSPRTFQLMHREQVAEFIGIDSKAKFIAKKCILGDTGDAIKPAAILCGQKCYETFIQSLEVPKDLPYSEELKLYKNAYMDFVGKHPKHKVHKDYSDIVSTISDAWDLNVNLGETMVDFEKLEPIQQKLFAFKYGFRPKLSSLDRVNSEIKRLVPHQENPFGGTISLPRDLYSKLSYFYTLYPNED